MTPPNINWNVPPDPQEIEQLRDAARLSWADKLDWLEEMQRLALFLQKQHAPRTDPHAR